MKYLQARYVYSHLFLALFSVEMITGTFYNRVYELERRKVDAQRSELRSQSNGTGDRTDKIRTYNFPQVCSTALHPWLFDIVVLILPFLFFHHCMCLQDRVTDHRIGLTINNVEGIMSGEHLSTLTDALSINDEKEKLIRFMESI